MWKEYNRFWTKERIEKATNLNLTPVQVIALASIVHKETVKKSERPIVAGVYLNRLAQGMPLQADPTVIYALKLRDHNFEQVIKRVLYNDLFIASPYNTYQNSGLPPGPIAMPDVDAIDAVLNPAKHNYIYFVQVLNDLGIMNLQLLWLNMISIEKICYVVKWPRYKTLTFEDHLLHTFISVLFDVRLCPRFI